MNKIICCFLMMVAVLCLAGVLICIENTRIEDREELAILFLGLSISFTLGAIALAPRSRSIP